LEQVQLQFKPWTTHSSTSPDNTGGSEARGGEARRTPRGECSISQVSGFSRGRTGRRTDGTEVSSKSLECSNRIVLCCCCFTVVRSSSLLLWTKLMGLHTGVLVHLPPHLCNYSTRPLGACITAHIVSLPQLFWSPCCLLMWIAFRAPQHLKKLPRYIYIDIQDIYIYIYIDVYIHK